MREKDNVIRSGLEEVLSEHPSRSLFWRFGRLELSDVADYCAQWVDTDPGAVWAKIETLRANIDPDSTSRLRVEGEVRRLQREELVRWEKLLISTPEGLVPADESFARLADRSFLGQGKAGLPRFATFTPDDSACVLSYKTKGYPPVRIVDSQSEPWLLGTCFKPGSGTGKFLLHHTVRIILICLLGAALLAVCACALATLRYAAAAFVNYLGPHALIGALAGSVIATIGLLLREFKDRGTNDALLVANVVMGIFIGEATAWLLHMMALVQHYRADDLLFGSQWMIIPVLMVALVVFLVGGWVGGFFSEGRYSGDRDADILYSASSAAASVLMGCFIACLPLDWLTELLTGMPMYRTNAIRGAILGAMVGAGFAIYRTFYSWKEDKGVIRRFESRFPCHIPEPTREVIKTLQSQFDEVFLIAEVDWQEVPENGTYTAKPGLVLRPDFLVIVRNGMYWWLAATVHVSGKERKDLFREI